MPSLWRKADDLDRKLAAFTLVDLLVVTVVLGLLTSLSLMAGAKATQKERSASCSANLKQLDAAWLLYAHDHEDALPPNITQTIGHLKQAMPGSWVVGNAQLDATSSNVQTGLLFHYTRATEVYRCPADHSRVDRHPDLLRARSYSLSCWLHGIANTLYDFRPATVPEDKSKYAQLVNPPPAEVFTFADEDESSIDDGSLTVPRGPDQWFDLPSDRHDHAANVAFADGHVERWRWASPKVFRAHRQSVGNAADRQDFERIKRAIPNP